MILEEANICNEILKNHFQPFDVLYHIAFGGDLCYR